MRSLFASLFGRSTPRSARPAPRLRLEGLEARDVPSITSSPQNLATTTSNNQFDNASASSTNGLSVAVWTHRFSSTDTDIHAQMFNADGSKRGSEIVVASLSRNESRPAVAIDNFGDWKVVWADEVEPGNRNLRVASYNSNGQLRRSLFTVAKTARDEFDPSIAVDSGGAFVVAYTRAFSSTDQDILAERRSDGGTLQTSFTVASGGGNERTASVARSKGADGRFAIAYQTNDDIVLKRYTSAATLVNTHTLASGSAAQINPSVAIDDIGRTVTVWQEAFSATDDDIKARTVSSTGGLGGTLNVSSSSVNEGSPTVAMDGSDGDFVVAWAANTTTIQAREFNATGTAKGSAYTVTTGGFGPVLSIDGADRIFITYTTPSTGSSGFDVFGRFGLLV